MKSLACSGPAFAAGTVATTLVIALLMVTPTTGATDPPLKLGTEVQVSASAFDRNGPGVTRRPDGKWVVVSAGTITLNSEYGVFMQLFNPDRSPDGGEVLVATTPQHPSNPHVAAMSDNSVVVVWTHSMGGASAHLVYAQALSSTSEKIQGPIQVSTTANWGGVSGNPKVVATSGSNVVICWSEGTQYGRRIATRRYQVSPSGMLQFSGPAVLHQDTVSASHVTPSVSALPSGGFVIVYNVLPRDIKCQIFGSTGYTVSSTFQVNTDTVSSQKDPAVAALPNGGFIVAWESEGQDGDGYAIIARHYGAGGTAIGAAFIVNTIAAGDQVAAQVATFQDNSFVIAWRGLGQSSNDMAIQRFDDTHGTVGSEILVNTNPTIWAPVLSIASTWTSGDFAVVYTRSQPVASYTVRGIAGQWFSDTLPTPDPPTPPPTPAPPSPPTKDGTAFAVNTYSDRQQNFPAAVRLPDGKWVVVWVSDQYYTHDIFMRVYTSERSYFRGEALVNTNMAGYQFEPKVAAAADSSFVIVWSDNHSGQYRIQSQRYDSSGAKVGAEFRVCTGSGPAYTPAVTYLTNGDVVYSWRENDRTMIRRYSPAFSPLIDPEEVNADPSQLSQTSPAMASLTGGGFVVVYSGAHIGSESNEVKGQIYGGDGAKVGGPFQLNTETSGGQETPDVSGLPDGDFIVAWQSTAQKVVVARHFAAVGTPIGAEVIVENERNTYRTPKVATFRDNSFAVVWVGDGIEMQYFDADHNKVGSHVIVNSNVGRAEREPSIAANWNDGEFGVFYASNEFKQVGMWTCFGPGPFLIPCVHGPPIYGSGWDIAGQWFVAELAPPPQTAPACASACLQYVCPEGKILTVKVTGVVSNDVFGSAYFTDDSSLAAAAVFAGLVADGETAAVTVKCSGPKPSFASASANGVTTQAFASPWPASFTFDLGGETLAPPPPSPERCYTEPCAQGKCFVQGTSFDIVVEGVLSNDVWGTEEFSDDSFVGSAAVHQGLLQVGSIGSVTVSCSGARPSLTGSTRNGVTTNSFGPWLWTYVVHAGPTEPPSPTTDYCIGGCLFANCPAGRELFLRIMGTVTGYAWGGITPYSDDSTVSLAAVHAGLVPAGATTIVKATCTGAQSNFTGSWQNGVLASSFGPHPASFELSAGTGMPTVDCGAGEQCLKDECTVKGRVIKVSVTGSTYSASQFWGTDLYAGDSPLSHAAVHAGLTQDNVTAVLYATCQGQHDSFLGTTANGLTSSSWNTPWPSSFTLSTTL